MTRVLDDDEIEICHCNNGEHLDENEVCPVNDPKNRCDTKDCDNIVIPGEGWFLGDERVHCCEDCMHSHNNGDDEPDFEQLHPNAGRDI